MSIKQNGGVFGRNPTFNDVTIEGELTFDGDIDINSDLKIDGNLDVDGTATFSSTLDVKTSGGSTINIQGSDGGSKNITFSKNTGNTVEGKIKVFSGDMSFFAGSSESMRIDESSGSLGIGHTDFANYSGKLVVADGSVGGSSFIDVTNNNNNQFVKIGINNNTALIAYDNADEIAFGQMANASGTSLATEHMRISSDGSVGINESDPTSFLSLGGNAVTTKKPSLSIVDMSNGGSINIRGVSPVLSFDTTGAGIPKILMDSKGVEFKDGTLDSEGSVAVKIDSSGHAIIPAGVTLGTAAGVHSAANTLNDYEEGAYTFSWTDGTTSINGPTGGGKYTKVGNIVTVMVKHSDLVTTNQSGNLQFTLPFAVDDHAYGTVYLRDMASSANAGLQTIQAIQNSNKFYIYLDTNQPLAASAFTSGSSNLYFSLTYRTTA